MPIIYTYPSSTPVATDLLLFSDLSVTDPQNATRKCSFQEVVDLVGSLVPGGGTVTSLGLLSALGGITISTTSTNPILNSGTFTIGGILETVNGGTGLNAYTNGDIVYYDSGNTFTRLTFASAPNGNGDVLTLAGGVPTWAATQDTGIISLGGLTGATQTFGNDTNVTMTSGGSAHNLGWTGTLAVTRGGTGLATIPTNSVLFTNALNTLTSASMANKGTLLVGTGGGSPPAIQAVGGDGNYLQADSTEPQGVAWYKPRWVIETSPATASQSIVDGNTLTVTGGTGITATVAATDSLTIAASYPGVVNIDNTLGLKDPAGNAATFGTNLALKWNLGPYVFIQFYMGNITKHVSATGDVIMTGLPHGAIANGVGFAQGSATMTMNDLFGSGTNPWAMIGRVGETAYNEMTIKGDHVNADSQIVDVQWSHVDTGETGNAVLAGTIQYFTEYTP
jgi:hypothetical protein